MKTSIEFVQKNYSKELFKRIIQKNYSKELFKRIIQKNYSKELFKRIIQKNYSKELFKRIIASLTTIFILFFPGYGAFAQCPPILEGPHSMCTFLMNTTVNYQIANYNTNATYNVFAVVGSTVIPFSVGPTGLVQLTQPFPSGTTQAMIIAQVTAPCTGADTIWIQPCCTSDPGGSNILSDITSDLIPNIDFTGTNYVYNPNSNPNQSNIIKISGQLDIVATTEFYNCTIWMDQGASIRIGDQEELVLINCTVESYCDAMWEGILCDNGSKFKIRDTTLIRDAQYGLHMTGTVLMDFWNHVQILNCFYGMFTPRGATANAPIVAGTALGLDLQITHTPNTSLLPGFYGQNPVPQTGSYAGVFFNDVANFNTVPGTVFTLDVSNMNIGFASLRGNLSLPYGYTATNIQPVTGEYTWSNYYNGSGIFCQSTNATPRTLTVGTDISQFNTFQNCKYGVHVNRNMNLTCKYNSFQNMTGMGGIRVTNCLNRAINIDHNNFSNGFYIGIHCATVGNSTLQIFSNYMDNGPNYFLPGQNMANTAIYVANKSKSTVNGYISYNTITAARIGIYIANSKGSAVNNKFFVQNNSITMDRSYSGLSFSGQWYYHYGIWAESLENVKISDNQIIRSISNQSAPPSFPYYKDLMTGINVKACQNGTVIKNNFINDFGTCIKTVGECNGTLYQCNTCALAFPNSNPNITQGFFFNLCSLTDQGNLISPSDNKWIGYGLGALPYRLVGNLNQTATNPWLDWHHRSSNNIYFPTPANVIGSLTVTGGITGAGPCGNDEENYEAIIEMVHRIVYDEIEYEYFPEESRYQDELWAFNVLHEDEGLRTSDPEYVLFYNERLDENIGEFHEIYQYMSDADYAEVISRINAMIEDNSIDHNLAFTLDLSARMENDPEYQISPADSIELTEIAWMTTWEGGEGVFNARHILGMEVDDALQFLRLASGNPANNHEALNPETLYDHLNGYENGRIELFDTRGRLVYSGTIGSLHEMNSLQPGVYTYSIKSGGKFSSKGKVMVSH